MKKYIVFLIAIFLFGCVQRTPEEPLVQGVKNGEIYVDAVEITLEEFEKDVDYRVTIDGEEYVLGTPFKEEGVHNLLVTATKGDKSTKVDISFEIDTKAPVIPIIIGVETGKVYFQKVNISVEKERGVTYEAMIDNEGYTLGSSFEEEGKHSFKVIATKDRNGLSIENTIPFTIDNTTYTPKEVDYFTEIALGAEYGGSPYVKKWMSDVKVKVGGNPKEGDLDRLNKVITELNEIIPTIDISIVEKDENINMYFVPQGDFRKYIPGAVGGNWAYFRYYTKNRWEIYKAIITIGTFGSEQIDRNHHIIEELTQALGMAKDSPKYRDSIFHETEGQSLNQEYSDLDKKVIEILYRDDIYLGMDKEEVLKTLEKRIVD